MPGTLGNMLATGLGAFGLGGGAPKLADHSCVVVFLLAEVAAAGQEVRLHESEAAAAVNLQSTFPSLADETAQILLVADLAR